MVMSRFEEAVEFHNLLKTVQMRFHNHPVAPILTQLIERMRDEALALALQEYTQYGLFEKQELSAKSGTSSGDSK